MTRPSACRRSPLGDRAPAALLAFALAVGALACRRAEPPAVLPSAVESGRARFARGELSRARVDYEHALADAVTEEEIAEARLFIVLTRMPTQTSFTNAAELRAVEVQYPNTRWGRIAALLNAEITRAEVLREAVMTAGADVRASEAKLAELRREIEGLEGQAAESRDALAAAREERARLAAQLKTANEHLAASTTQLRELEEKLEALKKIDMNRPR
ncbi:MAG: hypothetical protein KF850_35160 [Labilithrix sp.]|nr:hypothetical protein [Labilithrix sp.]